MMNLKTRNLAVLGAALVVMQLVSGVHQSVYAQARRDGAQAQRDGAQARRDGAQAQRDGAQARRAGAQAQRAGAQAQRAGTQARRDGAQERREITGVRSTPPRAATVSIQGVPIKGHEASRSARGGRFPIGSCVCVQDSPENPCPCDGPLIWLPTTGVIKDELTQRRSRAGEQIHVYTFARNTTAIVETRVSAPLSAVAAVLNNPTEARRLGEQVLGGRSVDGKGNTDSDVRYSRSPAWDAFKIGFAIGTWLDEEFALSDKISDWLVDTLED